MGSEAALRIARGAAFVIKKRREKMGIDKKFDVLKMLAQGFSLYYKVNRPDSARTVARLTKDGEKDIPIDCDLLEKMRVDGLLLGVDSDGKHRLNPNQFYRCMDCGFPTEHSKIFSETGSENIMCDNCGLRFDLGWENFGRIKLPIAYAR